MSFQYENTFRVTLTNCTCAEYSGDSNIYVTQHIKKTSPRGGFL